jgi:hypothetical protein
VQKGVRVEWFELGKRWPAWNRMRCEWEERLKLKLEGERKSNGIFKAVEEKKKKKGKTVAGGVLPPCPTMNGCLIEALPFWIGVP